VTNNRSGGHLRMLAHESPLARGTGMDCGGGRLRNAGVNTCRRVKVYACGLLVLLSATTSGCGTARHIDFRDTPRGIAFRYPAGWSVTGFSNTYFPSRLVAASDPVRAFDRRHRVA
jgi:hypothetical protein